MMRYIYLILIFPLCFAACNSSSRDEFQKRTGLSVSDTTFKLKGETDTYFVSEGEYSLVFKTTKKQIEVWLNNKPPWNNTKWNVGQIPHEIGICCQFNFPDRVGVSGTEKSGKSYAGDKNLEILLNDSTNYYVFREDCCPDNELRFHNGALLIIQPRTGLVYYSNWDY